MQFTMKCCGRKDPIGVDREHIRLEFEKDGGLKVDAWRVNIAISEENLLCGDYDIGTFCGEAGEAFLVYLDKSLLQDETRYYWQVEVETEEGRGRSDIASFETGPGSFGADWIGGPDNNGSVLNFQKEFEINGTVSRARLYLCGLGYFSADIDLKPLDDSFYKPLMTDYGTRYHPENRILPQASKQRFTYYTYDVTKQLQPGRHILSVDVANGYYCNTDRVPMEPDFSYDRPKLIFELHLIEEGKERIVRSGTDTLVRIMNYASTLYEGDKIDFTKEPEEYQRSILVAGPDGKPVSSLCEEDRVRQVLEPLCIKHLKGSLLYDFGINHTGGLEMEVEAEEGDELLIRYAEVLKADGTPNYETSAWHDEDLETGRTQEIYQINHYRLREGINRIRPLYSWYCYRYAEVEKPDTVKIRSMKSLFICSDIPENGHFRCNSKTLNRLNDMFIQTLLCNMHSGLVTDCPHREKRPYTGDGHLTMKASCYNLDSLSFYYKWLEDLLGAQTSEGRIPNTVPDLGGGGGYAWGNAICYVTEYLYRFTGDKVAAGKGFEAILRWLDYYSRNRDEDYVIRSGSGVWMLGDWLAPDTVTSDVQYISTVCYLMATDSALFLAQELHSEHVKELDELRQYIIDGINHSFFKEEQLSYGNGVQGEDVLALAVGIVPEQYRERLRDKVRYHYSEETGYHLDTGIVITPILLKYLTDNGCHDIAFRIMTADTYPSYYSLMEGDTTFSEHWSKKWPDFYLGGSGSRLVKGGGDVSHCHPMYGSVCAWLYERVAGLDLTELYRKKVVIRPYFTDCLTWGNADKLTAYGKVSVEWKQEEDGLILKAEIPQGLTGEVELPSSYKRMQNQVTGEIYQTCEPGYFRFQLPAGTWRIQATDEE